MEKFVLEAENISKNYGKVRALDAISFTARTGTIYGFIGPDGAGKTSLFRIAATLLCPDGGRMKVCGFDAVKDYRKLRAVLGYMPGRFSLYHDLTVSENLSFFASVFGTTVKENYHLIKDIYSHIEPFKGRRAGQLSGGMKQKLALSCALIHRPQLLLLDEPTTGIDAVSRKEFWALLRQLRNEGISVLVSTPYMDEAALCDHVALIQKGRILSTDTPEGITAAFRHHLFAVKACDMFSLVNALEACPLVRSAHLFGQEIHVTAHDANADFAENLKMYLAGNGLTDVLITSVIPSIEDCFIELMGEESGKKNVL